MHILQVGERHPGYSFPHHEIVEYSRDRYGHFLRFFWDSPSEREVEAVAAGPAEFGLWVQGPRAEAIFLLYRFGEAVRWSDAPFSWHLVFPERRVAPEDLPGEGHALLQVELAEARTGIVRALRAVTFSPEFTRAIDGAVKRQATEAPADPRVHGRAIEAAYAGHPTSEAMLRAAVAHCQGGE